MNIVNYFSHSTFLGKFFSLSDPLRNYGLFFSLALEVVLGTLESLNQTAKVAHESERELSLAETLSK